MPRTFSIVAIHSVLISYIGGFVAAVPAPQEQTSPTPTFSPTASHSATGTPSSLPASSGSGSDTTRYSVPKRDLAKIRLIVLVTIFCVLPLVGLWFCCYKMKRMLCFGGGKKRQHYNAAHPTQIPGGVYLVPVNAFVPPDQRTGYSARVDTPGNPGEIATAAPPYQQTGVVYPPRAVTPMTEKSGGWRSVFRH